MAEESSFDNKVKKYISSKKGWFIKYWAGSDFTKKGIPDILACINGRFYGIEDKSHNGRPRMLQLINLRDIRKAGGIGVLLYPKDFQNFKNLVDGKETGKTWYLENIALQNDWYDRLNQYL